jgi:hypothetical protein
MATREPEEQVARLARQRRAMVPVALVRSGGGGVRVGVRFVGDGVQQVTSPCAEKYI